jgi:hypothetical protein
MPNDTVDAGPSFEAKAATLGVATFAKEQEKAIARVQRRNRSKGQIDRWDLKNLAASTECVTRHQSLGSSLRPSRSTTVETSLSAAAHLSNTPAANSWGEKKSSHSYVETPRFGNLLDDPEQ